MNKQVWPSIGPVTGTWFDIPKQSALVYVPFGETRLNKMGLFYFHNHHWGRIEKSLDLVRLSPAEESKWIQLPDGKKLFVKKT